MRERAREGKESKVGRKNESQKGCYSKCIFKKLSVVIFILLYFDCIHPVNLTIF